MESLTQSEFIHLCEEKMNISLLSLVPSSEQGSFC